MNISDNVVLGVICALFAGGLGYLTYNMPVWLYMFRKGKSRSELTEDEWKEIMELSNPPRYIN